MADFIPVHEIFVSIQGEGPDVGRKAIFVRVAGCSFRCPWCDSSRTWTLNDSKKYSPEELSNILIEISKKSKVNYVVLTGGNPCMYDFTDVIKPCLDEGLEFAVETQGDLYPAWMGYLRTVVLSPKAPSSGQPDVYDKVSHYLQDIMAMLPRVIAIKIPVFGEEDMEFVEKYYNLIRSCHTTSDVRLYLSVGNENVEEGGDISPRILAKYHELIDRVLESGMEDVYVLPQLHTLVWGNKAGV